jgi:hypothetical protein
MSRIWVKIPLHEAKQHPLYGIKSWLALFCFFMLSGEFIGTALLITEIHKSGITVAELLTLNANHEIIARNALLTSIGTLFVFCFVLFTKHPKFRLVSSLLVLLPFPIICLSGFLYPVEGAGGILGLELPKWIASCCIWISYLNLSKRVRVTFENHILQSEPNQNTDTTNQEPSQMTNLVFARHLVGASFFLLIAAILNRHYSNSEDAFIQITVAFIGAFVVSGVLTGLARLFLTKRTEGKTRNLFIKNLWSFIILLFLAASQPYLEDFTRLKEARKKIPELSRFDDAAALHSHKNKHQLTSACLEKLQEARKRIPELTGLSDESAINVIHQAYYPDRSRQEIEQHLGCTLRGSMAAGAFAKDDEEED